MRCASTILIVSAGRSARARLRSRRPLEENAMRRLLTVSITAAILAVAPSAAPASQTPVAHVACTSAKIGGQRKCIARGQFCAHAQQRDYKRYGLSCSKRDRNGRQHLV